MSSKTEFKILVVDDDESMLDLMTLRFNKMGLKVERATDGRMAQKLIERTTFDLIVTDIYMPGGTGLSLLRKAKEQDPHTQVIVITAGATLENAIEALNNGAFAYLTKPFDHVSVFDNVVSRALEFRRLVLDNQRMAEIQRRRGDMLEDEVAERVQQLRERQRDLLDLLGALPDGVVVVEEGGKVVLSSPVAEKWLTREMRMAGQPIQRFIETIHDEWAEEEAQVEVGEHTLRLMAADLPSEEEEKKRKVVVIHEAKAMPADYGSQMVDPLARVKQGLAWLYKQKMGTAVLDVLKQLAVQINELERLSGLSGGENGRSHQPQIAARADHPSKTHVEDMASAPSEAQVEDQAELPSEAQVEDQVELASEPPIDIAERLPSSPSEVEEQTVKELTVEEAPTTETSFQSGLLQKHLDTQPKEKIVDMEQVAEEALEDAQSVSDSDEALDTMQEILDGELEVDASEDQLAIGEDFFKNLEEELSLEGGDVWDLDDTPSEEPLPSSTSERSKTKDSNWPPQRPSEMDDFEEYK
jgi:DNA-binding response OmpR family regulator